MLPTRSLGIISPTGGEQMQMGVVLPIAPMGVEHRDVTPSECLAPDGAVEIIQALPPTAHERAQHDRRVLVKVVRNIAGNGKMVMRMMEPAWRTLPTLLTQVVTGHLAH